LHGENRFGQGEEILKRMRRESRRRGWVEFLFIFRNTLGIELGYHILGVEG
jgi:hypothetical protein